MKNIQANYLLGIGGMGMSGIANYLHSKNQIVAGSDREYNRGRCLKLNEVGIEIHPQGGMGLEKFCEKYSDLKIRVISSTAVENSVPEVIYAKKNKLEFILRGDFLEYEFNTSKIPLGICGSAGKTTTSALLIHILKENNINPDFIIGGMLENIGNGGSGDSGIFISELDESQGNVSRYKPETLLFTNLFEEHKKLSELREDFSKMIEKMDENGKIILATRDKWLEEKFENRINYIKYDIKISRENLVNIVLNYNSEEYSIPLPGMHNYKNILLAVYGAETLKIKIEDSLKSLENFAGVEMRMKLVGKNEKLTLFNDFAHAPIEINTSYNSFKNLSKKMIYVYQPHGYTPTYLQKHELLEVFGSMRKEDILVLTDIYYGGEQLKKK